MNRIHFLNTVWSDAILLESNGKYAFVDTGKKLYYPMIKDYLTKLGVKEIEFIFLTHFHNDHYGSIPFILDDYKVKKVYLRAYSGHDGTSGDGTFASDEYHINEWNTYISIRNKCDSLSELVMIDENLNELDFGDFHFDILANTEVINKVYNDESLPYYHIDKLNENYDCVSLFTRLNGINIYLGADVTNCENSIECMDRINLKEMTRIMKKYDINHVHIYKTSHHGVHDSTHPDIANLMNPDYCIITNTDRWLDRYPTVNWLKEANKDTKILKTDFYQYVFTITNEGVIKVETIDLKSLFDE